MPLLYQLPYLNYKNLIYICFVRSYYYPDFTGLDEESELLVPKTIQTTAIITATIATVLHIVELSPPLNQSSTLSQVPLKTKTAIIKAIPARIPNAICKPKLILNSPCAKTIP